MIEEREDSVSTAWMKGMCILEAALAFVRNNIAVEILEVNGADLNTLLEEGEERQEKGPGERARIASEHIFKYALEWALCFEEVVVVPQSLI